MEIEKEKIRIVNYFNNVMKEISIEILNHKILKKKDIYLLFESNSLKEQILAKPKHIKYKFSKKHLPRVRVKSEFKSLRNNMQIGLKASFSIRKISKLNSNENLEAKKFYVEEYILK